MMGISIVLLFQTPNSSKKLGLIQDTKKFRIEIGQEFATLGVRIKSTKINFHILSFGYPYFKYILANFDILDLKIQVIR